MRMMPRGGGRRVNIDLFNWNPLMPEYGGAAAVFIVLYLFFQVTNWFVLLFGMIIGFAVVHLIRPNPRK